MMRFVSRHNSPLTIGAIDEPGAGGANHRYVICGFNAESNPSRFDPLGHKIHNTTALDILFQNGVINDAGINGVTIEALLAVCADRLRGFQSGPYPCRENESALSNIEDAIACLDARMARVGADGVDGDHVETQINELYDAEVEDLRLQAVALDEMKQTFTAAVERLGIPDGNDLSARNLADIAANIDVALDSIDRMADVLTSVRVHLGIDDNESILEAIDALKERPQMSLQSSDAAPAIVDDENAADPYANFVDDPAGSLLDDSIPAAAEDEGRASTVASPT